MVEALKDHPIVAGVSDIWGPSDVYRTYKEGTSLPEGCTAIVWGQPLMGRSPDDAPNLEKEPLPVAWFKNWKTSDGKLARVFQSTMGSAKDLQSAGNAGEYYTPRAVTQFMVDRVDPLLKIRLIL